jgi:hypothetical protein
MQEVQRSTQPRFSLLIAALIFLLDKMCVHLTGVLHCIIEQFFQLNRFRVCYPRLHKLSILHVTYFPRRLQHLLAFGIPIYVIFSVIHVEPYCCPAQSMHMLTLDLMIL